MWIIKQDRPPLVAFSDNSQVFVVEREIDIFDIQGESLVVSSDDLLPGSTLRSSELTLIMYGCIGAGRRSSYIMAAIDRVIHHCVILDMMTVESYRAQQANHQQLQEREQAKSVALISQ